MSGISLVTADWLALRAAADDAARSVELAGIAAQLLRDRLPEQTPLVVHDLGSGTGAMMRWLASRLPGPQTWVLHDGDPAILAQHDATARDDAGDPVAVRTSVEPLAELGPEALAGASLVTASALLDVVTLDEARRIVDACVALETPALFSLSVIGVVVLDPPDPLDAALGDAFDDHQRRLADGRRLLGPGAPAALRHLFAGAGWQVRGARTPWRLGSADRALVAAWLDGWVGAAVEQRPELAEQAAAFRSRRRAQLAADELRVVVHHEDLLAWPR